MDGVSVFPRLLLQLEADNIYNSINFSLDYNDVGGQNTTAYHAVFSGFLCPSTSRGAGASRDLDGYGMTDYGATCYTDISPTGAAPTTPQPSPTPPATPLRDVNSRADGVLKHGTTRIPEIRDGLSNSLTIAEDAGRDSRFTSAYTEDWYDGVTKRTRPVANPTGTRRFWRWGEADCSIGVSGGINNKYRPQTTPPYPAGIASVDAGANDEIFSFHPGGAHALFGDGSARFLNESIYPTVLRGLVTAKGREVISADSY